MPALLRLPERPERSAHPRIVSLASRRFCSPYRPDRHALFSLVLSFAGRGARPHLGTCRPRRLSRSAAGVSAVRLGPRLLGRCANHRMFSGRMACRRLLLFRNRLRLGRLLLLRNRFGLSGEFRIHVSSGRHGLRLLLWSRICWRWLLLFGGSRACRPFQASPEERTGLLVFRLPQLSRLWRLAVAVRSSLA